MRIVSFTRSVPFDGIPHAGGEYYLRHVRALIAAGHEVVIVAADDEENRSAVQRSSVSSDALLIRPVGPRLLYYADRFNIRFRVAVPPERLLRGFASDQRVLAAVEQADLLEYQWTEFAAIHGRLPRRIRLRVPAVAVAHDVLTQKFAREARTDGLSGRERAVALAKSLLVRADETRMLRRMRVVVTFSVKDAGLLEGLLGWRRRVLTIDPPLEPIDRDWLDPRRPQRGEVLFVGAFYRPENAAGAVWFLEEVWPKVLSAFPDARLRLVGTGPTAAMRAAAERQGRGRVEITGYVDDLGPSYRSATVAVVPLRAGAGVKFKTITAMLWGVPVVATTIGAEGIGGSGERLFVDIADEPARFAAAVVSALSGTTETAEIAATAKQYAVRTHGSARFAEVLTRLYRSLSTRSAPGASDSSSSV